MSKNIAPILIQLGDIAGMYYSCGYKTDKIVVYGIGAPMLPDNGNLPDAPFILKRKIDVFVPDYIGYGRSKGIFTPKNCIKTFLDTYDSLVKGCEVGNFYSKFKKYLKYKDIYFIGRSLGGAYVPLLPKYNSEINKLAIIYPAVDQKAQGKVKGEETNQDFLESMDKDGYKYIYRGIMTKVWEKHLENEDGLSPMDNIQYLQNTRLFIGHGKKDECIHFSKSKLYFENILKMFPDRTSQFKLKLYTQGDHSPTTSNLAIQDFLDWIEV